MLQVRRRQAIPFASARTVSWNYRYTQQLRYQIEAPERVGSRLAWFVFAEVRS